MLVAWELRPRHMSLAPTTQTPLSLLSPMVLERGALAHHHAMRGRPAGVDRESEPLLYAVVEKFKFKTLCLAPPSSVHSTRDSDPESDAPAGAGSGVASLISSSCLWLK